MSYRGKIMALIWLVLVPINVAMAYEKDTVQQKIIKTVFVFNIAKFASWPVEFGKIRTQPFMLCHFVEDSLGVGFEIIRNRRVNGRRLSKRVSLTLAETKMCDILFIGQGRLDAFHGEFPVSDLTKVLVVADRTQALSKGRAFEGVHISLVREEANIGLEINVSELSKSKVELSPELLELSTIVSHRL